MDSDNPAIVTEIGFHVHARTRDGGIAMADEIANAILARIGGEPWVMVDDDWHRAQPPKQLTLVDDEGFMYCGTRRYVFSGPFIGKIDAPLRDGYRVQGQGVDQ